MEQEQEQEMKKIIFPAQHLGPITSQEAERQLREIWPQHIVRRISVSKTAKFFSQKCGLEHLEIEAHLVPGYSFDNYFSRPAHDQHWPPRFQPFQVCNCKLEESYNV